MTRADWMRRLGAGPSRATVDLALKSGPNPNYAETVPVGSSSDLRRSSTLS
jgi:hypothetical protein